MMAILFHLVVVLLLYITTVGADDCAGVRCGEECTGALGFCTCGKDAKKFTVFDNTTWCCNASLCERNGIDIICMKGTPLPLTTPCQGHCNTADRSNTGRKYRMCESKDQCVKIQYWQDNEAVDCKDHSDEKKMEDDVFSPIQWDKLATCYVTDDRSYPGVKCSGQGLSEDCLPYKEWCRETWLMQCEELGGRTSVHTEICSNKTFWSGRPCKYGDLEGSEGRRCSTKYPGQCSYSDSAGWTQNPRTCTEHISHGIPSSGSSAVLECSPIILLALLIRMVLHGDQKIAYCWG